MNELNLFFVLYFEAIILNDSYIYPKERWAKIIDQFSRIILLLM